MAADRTWAPSLFTPMLPMTCMYSIRDIFLTHDYDSAGAAALRRTSGRLVCMRETGEMLLRVSAMFLCVMVGESSTMDWSYVPLKFYSAEFHHFSGG